MNKKSKKGKYQTSMGNSSIALVMDLLRDSYRFREKMFPALISIGDSPKAEYKTLREFAESFEQESSYPDVCRYDLEGNFIKKHVYRQLN